MPERPGLVAGRRDDAAAGCRAADDQRLAGEIRLLQDLDRREERVQVDMRDRCCHALDLTGAETAERAAPARLRVAPYDVLVKGRTPVH